MADKQIYNLDEVLAEKQQRFVIWKGKEHEVVGATGETYLKFVSYQGQLNKATDEKAQFEMAMKLLGLVTPTLPTEEVMKLEVGAIKSLVNFVTNGFAEEAGQDAKSGASGGAVAGASGGGTGGASGGEGEAEPGE